MSMLEPEERSTESRTKQSFRDEVDINKIVARARQGHAVTHLSGKRPMYMDVSEVGDYKGALDMLRAMDAYFMQLPSEVRLKFQNDPAVFLDAVDTDAGRAELEKLGLIPKLPETVPVPGRAPVEETPAGGEPPPA